MLVAQIAAFLVVFAISLSAILERYWFLQNIVSEPNVSYDYIIVGGGTAGCVLAGRLRERTNKSILVIESGHIANWISTIPLFAPLLQNSIDWSYRTAPQTKSQFGMKDQKSAWPRGKVLGGSSVINYMLHMWGTKADFNEVWSHVDPGWNFGSVSEYYRRMEEYPGTNSGVRGKNGPMYVEDFDEESPSAEAFVKGMQSLGIDRGDLNGELEDGVMISQSNIRNGIRVSTFDAYVYPVMKKANIHFLTYSTALEVQFHKNEATGVTVYNEITDRTYTIMANREILVAAGVVGSPKLLMLSGIGPRSSLRKQQIRIVKNLPGVGRNLRDPLNVPMYFHIKAPVSITTEKVKSISEMLKYTLMGKGRLSHTGVEAIARLPVSNSTTHKMLFMLFNVGTVEESLFSHIANLKQDAFLETFPESHNASKEGFIVLASCTHPKSTGVVELLSRSPFDDPVIDPKYLTEEEDTDCLVEAMRVVAKLGQTAPLRLLGAELHLPRYKDCDHLVPSTYNKEYLKCWMKVSAMTSYHPSGTCAMGPKEDNMAVLDGKLRVHGTKKLRVVDNSVFPFPVAANPHATVLMLAEKAVDLILSDTK